MKQLGHTFLISSSALVLSLVVSGCGDKASGETTETSGQPEQILITDVSTPITFLKDAPATEIQPSEPERLMAIKPKVSISEKVPDKDGFITLEWDDLEEPGFGKEEVMKQFEKEAAQIPEGDPREKEVLARYQEVINAAPVNEELNGRKIKLRGFVTALEVNRGHVNDFLLVPYYGACIHVPPPPINQTLYIKPDAEQNLRMRDTYLPVTVIGTIRADKATTELAEVGYQIIDAKIEITDRSKLPMPF